MVTRFVSDYWSLIIIQVNMRTCPDCHSTVSSQAKFCDTCGYPLEQDSPRVNISNEKPGVVSYGTCSACGYSNIAGETFCQQCGVQLPPVMSSPPPPPTPVQPQKIEYKAGWLVPDDSQVVEPPPEKCVDCGFKLNPGDKFCPNCGNDLSKIHKESEVPSNSPQFVDSVEEPAPVKPVDPADKSYPAHSQPSPAKNPMVCPSCGSATSIGEIFCPVCGLKLDERIIPVSQPDESESPKQIKPDPVSSSLASPGSQPVNACPVCGWEYSLLEDTFCPNCGQFLETQPGSPEPQRDDKSTINIQELTEIGEHPGDKAIELTEISGKFVIGYTNQEIYLPSGKTEVIIGRSDPEGNIFPEIDLTAYGGDVGGVSRKHAVLAVKGSQIYIEDLNSTNFTYLNKSKLEPENQYPLNDGDEIRMGGLILHYYMEKS